MSSRIKHTTNISGCVERNLLQASPLLRLLHHHPLTGEISISAERRKSTVCVMGEERLGLNQMMESHTAIVIRLLPACCIM